MGKRYDKLTVPMLSCICCRERLYLERFVLYIYWSRHKLMELMEQLCLEESVELKTLLKEITTFENPIYSSLHSVQFGC